MTKIKKVEDVKALDIIREIREGERRLTALQAELDRQWEEAKARENELAQENTDRLKRHLMISPVEKIEVRAEYLDQGVAFLKYLEVDPEKTS